jgi:hypothetical protein
VRPIKAPAVFDGFLRAVDGHLVDGLGQRRLLRGVGLGSWLLAEGYMWRFGNQGPQSPREIEQFVTGLVGDEQARRFWTGYRDNFITEADIEQIAAEGMDHVRLPINARLVIEDSGVLLESGLLYIDSLIEWCRRHHLWVILDLHGAPGGQTGTNIDDSPNGEPDLFAHAHFQDLTVVLWEALAKRYQDEPVVAGYDLLNEPLPGEWQARYSTELVLLYKRITAAIRAHDVNHLIIYEGTHWATNWSIFEESWDENSMLQFHKYWSTPDRASIEQFLAVGQRLGLPIYAGEVGENNLEWLQLVFQLFEDCDISWNLWTWKKVDSFTSPCSVIAPPGWYTLVAAAEGREAAPADAQAILDRYFQALPIGRCHYRKDVLNSVMRKAPLRISAVGYGHRGPGVSYGTSGSPSPHAEFRTADAVTVVARSDQATALAWDHHGGSPRSVDQELQVVLSAADWLTYEVVTVDCGFLAVEVVLASNTSEMREPCLLVKLDGRALPAVQAGDRLEARSPSTIAAGVHIIRLLALRSGTRVSSLSIAVVRGLPNVADSSERCSIPAVGGPTATTGQGGRIVG